MGYLVSFIKMVSNDLDLWLLLCFLLLMGLNSLILFG